MSGDIFGRMRIVGVAAVLCMGTTAGGCERKGGPLQKPEETGGGQAARGGAGTITISGAGATFPYPLYSKWIDVYHRMRPDVQVDYQSIGSGGGIRQILERTVDFGASDVPMTDEELARAQGKLLHLPSAAGAVVLVYNLPGAPTLALAPEVVVDIYRGTIGRWDDPRIAAANPAVSLPARPIVVVHRTDGSGTTAVFTGFLAATSAAWKQQVGAGKSIRFPTGLGAKGNEGVAGQVKTTPGAVGYVELAYAKQTGLPAATIRNAAGRFVAPTPEGISAAAAGAVATLPADLRISIVNAPGPDAYPIASFTYLLVPQEQRDPRKGRALVDFLWWAIHDGQQYAAPLDYAPLPPAVVARGEQVLASVVGPDGRPLLEAPAKPIARHARP